MNIILSRKKCLTCKGKEFFINATVEGAEGVEIVWTSSDESVASIYASGFIQVVGDGSAVLTATAKNTGISAECELISKYLPYFDTELMGVENVKVLRRAQAGLSNPMPQQVKDFLEYYFGEAERIAEEEYRETGRWFYIRPERTGAPKGAIDSATTLIYNILTQKYELEETPNYSKENWNKAVAYWQSWQNKETGLFFSPELADPKNPGDPDELKKQFTQGQKGMSGLFGLLKASPLYPMYSAANADVMDYDSMWADATPRNEENSFNSSAAGKHCSHLNLRIHGGDTDLLPFFEAYVSCILSLRRAETGITKYDRFHEYFASENNIKMLGRLIGYMGIRNLPYIMTMADSMIKYKDEILWGNVNGNIRNMIELCYYSILYHDYRRDELFAAIEHLSQFVDLKKGEPLGSYGYMFFGMCECGTYLNWEGFPRKLYAFTDGYRWGLPFHYRYFMGPYSRWMNAELKEPHEIIGHPDFDYEKSGMETETTEMRKWAIYNKIQPIGYQMGYHEPDARGDIHWYYTTEPAKDFHTDPSTTGLCYGKPDFSGDLVSLKAVVQLKDVSQFKMPFLKARFKGIFNVYLNGEVVKSLPTGMWRKEWERWVGFYIPKAQRGAIKEGENIITVEFTRQFEDSYISIGVIDWK